MNHSRGKIRQAVSESPGFYLESDSLWVFAEQEQLSVAPGPTTRKLLEQAFD